jgi:hypothetical protein
VDNTQAAQVVCRRNDRTTTLRILHFFKNIKDKEIGIRS